MKKRVDTVIVQGEDGIDPHLLMLDGRDVRSVSRAERRLHGFRGPVMTAQAPTLVRFVRRNYAGTVIDRVQRGLRLTRRQRKVAARTRRFAVRRGLT